MSDIKLKLISKMFASCECNTKTPNIQYHDELCLTRVLSEALNEIERLTAKVAELENPWVSVDDRLPEKSTAYLTRDKYEDEEVYFFEYGGWYCNSSNTDYPPYSVDFITHWMPIPPLPTKGEE